MVEHKPRGKILAPVGRMEYDPVVDNLDGKYTAISLVKYHHSTGLIMRGASSGEKLLAYCAQDPREVFSGLFGKFEITRFNGREFYGSSDFKDDTPMIGLSVVAMDPVVGISGVWSDDVSAGVFDEALRKGELSPERVQRAIENVSGYGLTTNGEMMAMLSSQFKQRKFEKQQLVDLLTPYIKN